jgi:murein DD-endopeptidase MepM/ murein hydrolase activator NlpD
VRWVVAFAAISALAQNISIQPREVPQGETVKVHAGSEIRSARLNGRSFPLFSEPDGGSFGLVPVGVHAKPGTYNLEFLDESGGVVTNVNFTVLNAHYRKQNIIIAKAIAALKPSPGEQEAVGTFRKEITPERYWKEPLELPVPGCMTSPFGVERLQNGKPTGDYHAGIDQRAAAGSPIHAIAGGVVKLVQKYNLRGGTVAIDHGQGLESIYMHMSKLAAREGDHVKQGDVIGYAGSTGRSTGPHLHWTMYVDGDPVNPGQWVHLKPCAASK